MFILKVESPSAIVLAGRASLRAGSRYHAARSFYDARGIAPKMRQCPRWQEIPEGDIHMAENGGLPAWVGAWVGKVVQVHVHGDPDPLFGVLEDWDQRGVVLRHTEDMVRLTASRVEDVPSDPMMILVTWSAVRYVSVLLEELEKD